VRLTISILEIAATLVVLARMLIVGFLAPSGVGGILNWAMFCHLSSVFVDVEVLDDGRWQPVNIFDLTPSGRFSVATGELQSMVDYLMTIHEEVRGSGSVLYADGEFFLTIVAGRVEVSDRRVVH
jgi:hypothetical protein